MSFGDYMWNEPYARCVAKNDTASIAQLESTYLQAAIRRRRLPPRHIKISLSVTTSPTSCSCMSEHSMPACSRASSSSTATRASPSSHFQAAENDPFYASAIDPSLPDQPDALEGAMQARNLPLPTRPKPSIDPNSLVTRILNSPIRKAHRHEFTCAAQLS